MQLVKSLLVGVCQQLVLHSGIASHHEALLVGSIYQQEIGLARLQYSDNACSAPVGIDLLTVFYGHLHDEVALVVNVATIFRSLSGKDAIGGYHVFAIPVEYLLGEVFQPAHERYRVASLIAIILKGRQILCGIVGQLAGGNQRVGLLLAIDKHLALALLLFVDNDIHFLAIVSQRHHHLVTFRSDVVIVPELTVVDGVLLGEADVPVASLFVTPHRLCEWSKVTLCPARQCDESKHNG